MLQVVVPPGMGPGQQLQVSANGTMLAVTIPQGVGPGMAFALACPPQPPQPPQQTMLVPVIHRPRYHSNAGTSASGGTTGSQWKLPKATLFNKTAGMLFVASMVFNYAVGAAVDGNRAGVAILFGGPVLTCIIVALIFWCQQANNVGEQGGNGALETTHPLDKLTPPCRDKDALNNALATWFEKSSDASEAAVFCQAGLWVAPTIVAIMLPLGFYFALLSYTEGLVDCDGCQFAFLAYLTQAVVCCGCANLVTSGRRAVAMKLWKFGFSVAGLCQFVEGVFHSSGNKGYGYHFGYRCVAHRSEAARVNDLAL